MVTVNDVISAICQLPDKSYMSPTYFRAPHLKHLADLIAPLLMELFSRLLSTATVPEVFKLALIMPLLKKPDLDSTDPQSYRPISNLSVVSKPMQSKTISV